MNIKARLDRIEKRRGRRNEYAHLTDEQLQSRILALAGELNATGWLTKDIVAQIETAGLWIPERVGK